MEQDISVTSGRYHWVRFITLILAIVRRGMVDMEQIIYPWGLYETSDIEATYITPYLTVKVQQNL